MKAEGLPFQLAADFLGDAIFLLEPLPDARILWLNAAGREAMGRSCHDDLSGQPITRFLTPQSAEAAEHALKRLSNGDAPHLLLDLEFLQPDLTAFRVEAHVSRILMTPDGGCLAAVVGRSATGRDQIAQQRNRAEFQSLQFQAALLEVAGSDFQSLDEHFRKITGVAASVLDVSSVAVWLFDDSHTAAHRVHRYDRDHNRHEDAAAGMTIEVHRYPRHFEALEQARVIAAEDALEDPLTSELADDYLRPGQVTSILDVPIRRGGRTIGVLCHEHRSEPRPWRLEERSFAGSLADLTALALESHRRREAEAELRKSHGNLELFFSQSLDGFFFMMLDEPIRWDPAGSEEAKQRLLDYVFGHERMIKANDALLRQYGWTRDSTLGTTPGQLFAHALEHGRDLWRRMFDAGRLHVESDERRADGSRMWVEGDYICFHDGEGRITGHFGIQRDITSRVEAEEKLRHYNRRLTLLQNIDRAILSAGSSQEVARAALERIQELLTPARAATVIEFDPPKGVARLVGAHPPQPLHPPGAEIPIDAFGGLAAQPPPFSPNVPEVCSWVSLPLVAEGESIGVLNLGCDHADACQGDELEVATEVANSLAVAIRHAQLNGRIASYAAELEQRVEARTLELSRVNASLRDSEERLAGIFDSAMDAILVLDSATRLVMLNEAAEKIFHFENRAAVLGRPIDELLSEDLLALVRSYVSSESAVPVRAPAAAGMFARRVGGEQFPVEASLSRTGTQAATLFTITLRDINEKKQTEERLEELRSQNLYLQDEIRHELNFEEIVGSSQAMQQVFAAIEMVANTDSTVLLLGETGTGKELIARAVHNRSRRRQNAMIKVNCGALPANLIESELFGHERGAFTGAVAQKKGRFELAHRGTIFLDEIGELPLDSQVRLLRVLQEQEIERVGGSHPIRVDVRVIAATNRNLTAELQKGAFRADLYYRLNVFPIEVPPLRERRDDIPALSAYFARKFSERTGKRIAGIRKETMSLLQSYDWPGNVRELANLLERAVILCQTDALDARHINLPHAAAAAAPLDPTTASPSANVARLPKLEEAERKLILDALRRTNGVLAGPAGAAQLLGLNRSTLWSRMRKLGITKDDF